jgi:hypothetical protein
MGKLETKIPPIGFQQLLPQNYEAVNHYIHQFIASAQKLKGISVLFLFSF